MSLEIREPLEDELGELAFAIAYSFNGDRSPEGLERTRRLFRLRQPLAAFEDGKLVAGLGVLPLAIAANGGTLPFGGVSSVACLPEHRRKGYVGKLLHRILELMHERGQVVSGLYTEHFPLYRRYGWILASLVHRYSFAPKDIGLTPSGRPQGQSLRVSRDQWSGLDTLYRTFIARRNGYLVRSEHWWRTGVLRSPYGRRDEPADIAVWARQDGVWQGYVVYFIRPRPDAGSELRVRDFVALDGDAYLGLLHYLLQHDQATEIVWDAPVDDPFLSVVDDPRRVRVQLALGMMHRLVDVAQAIAGRPCLIDTPGESLVLELADTCAPWNQGVWRLEAEGGRVEVKKTDRTPDLSLDVAALAPLFSGLITASEAARSRRLTVYRESALQVADRIFAPRCPPFTADWF